MRLVDAPVPVRIKLAALWASVMFCYVYGDFFGLFRPGKLADMLAGRTPLGPTTQGMLVGFAIVMAIPSAMVILSLVLPPGLLRGLSIVLGILYSIIMVLALRGAWGFYVLLACVEIAMTLAIVGYAWRWPRASDG